MRFEAQSGIARGSREPWWRLGATCRFPHNLAVNLESVALASLRLSSGQARPLSGRRLAFPLIVLALPIPDPGYTPALAAANRFLQAWQSQDHETGLLMLTDAAKQYNPEDRLESCFSGGLDAAYEIRRGKKLKAGRYAFPVTLFTSHSDNRLPRPYESQIIVVRACRDDGAIDKLP
jgi:hypothetical protein